MGILPGFGIRVEDLIADTPGILAGLLVNLFLIEWQNRR